MIYLFRSLQNIPRVMYLQINLTEPEDFLVQLFKFGGVTYFETAVPPLDFSSTCEPASLLLPYVPSISLFSLLEDQVVRLIALFRRPLAPNYPTWIQGFQEWV